MNESRSDGMAPPGTQQWAFETSGGIKSSPLVVDGTVYVGSQDNNLYAIDTVTGTEKWTYKTEYKVHSSPAVADGTVYVGSQDHNLYAIDAATGAEKWTYETGDKVLSSPAVADGTVYVGSQDYNLHAIDAVTGTEQWVYGTSGTMSSSPAVTDGTVYVGSWDDNLYAIDTTTGSLEWQFKTTGGVSTPVVADGVVYVGSWDEYLYAVDATNGTEAWRFEAGKLYSSPVVADGTVYVGSRDHNLYAVDATTGNCKWQFKTGDPVRSSPAVIGGTVYIGSDNLYAVDATTGTGQWVFETGGIVDSSPTVADGTIYVGSRDRNLYAVSTSLPASTQSATEYGRPTNQRGTMASKQESQNKPKSPVLEPGDFVYLIISRTESSVEKEFFNRHLGILLGSERFPVIEQDLIHSPYDTTKSYILAVDNKPEVPDRTNTGKVIPAPSIAEVFDQPTADLLSQLGLDSVAAFLTADLSQVASQPIDTDKLREMREALSESLNQGEVFTVSVDEVYRWPDTDETDPSRT